MRDQLLPPSLPPPPGSSASKLSGALWRRGGKEGVLAKLIPLPIPLWLPVN